MVHDKVGDDLVYAEVGADVNLECSQINTVRPFLKNEDKVIDTIIYFQMFLEIQVENKYSRYDQADSEELFVLWSSYR